MMLQTNKTLCYSICILEPPKSDGFLFFLQKHHENLPATSNLTGNQIQRCFKPPSLSLNMYWKVQGLL